MKILDHQVIFVLEKMVCRYREWKVGQLQDRFTLREKLKGDKAVKDDGDLSCLELDGQRGTCDLMLSSSGTTA